MLRAFFIYLSNLRWMRDLILKLVFTRKASRRFVAGETCQDAMGVIAAQAQQNILSTIDHLGESVETEAQARRRPGLRGCARLHGRERRHIARLAQADTVRAGCERRSLPRAGILRHRKAAQMGTFVRIDMEGSPHTERQSRSIVT